MSENFHILKVTRGNPTFKSLGKTRHRIISDSEELTAWADSVLDGRPIEAGYEIAEPHELRIVKYESDSGVYLFYCDKNGMEMTDTYHDSVKQAMIQAEFEYGIKPDDWNDWNDPNTS